VQPDQDILIVTSKGYGKRTPVSDYRIQGRGGKGIKTINVTDKNGPVVSLKVVKDDEDLMIITSSGTLIRTSMEGISTMGRYTQGVKLINIREDDSVGTVCRSDKTEETEELDDEEFELDGNNVVTDDTTASDAIEVDDISSDEGTDEIE
jgi:DNA gyrase subunit A